MLNDDWRSVTNNQLQQSSVYHKFLEKCEEDTAGASFRAQVEDAVYYAFQRTKLIAGVMREYTLHDGDHLFRVLYLMERLLTKESLDNLSVPELGLLILSSFFHDIGMAPSADDVQSWLSCMDSIDKRRQSNNSHQEFVAFIRSRPGDVIKIEKLQQAGLNNRARLIQEHLVTEYIRQTHARRAREVIKDDFTGKIYYRDTDLALALARLCESHNLSAVDLLRINSSLLCGPGVYLRFAYLGILLRLADLLDFDSKRTPSVLFANLGLRNPVSLAEWQKHRSVEAWDIGPTKIAFRAICEHPATEAAIREFCDYIDAELAACAGVIRQLERDSDSEGSSPIRLPLPASVDRSQIGAKRDVADDTPLYRYSTIRFTLDQKRITELLMGTALYGDPSLALRELVQNSLDACSLRTALSKSWNIPYQPEIAVTISRNADGHSLVVSDNGTGMDEKILEDYYARVGTSFYRSAEFHKLRANTALEWEPISRFGIGILACFMVSESFEIQTKRIIGPYDSTAPIKAVIEGRESLFWFSSGDRSEPGTETRLFLLDDHPWKDIASTYLVSRIRSVIPNPSCPIMIDVDGEAIRHDGSGFLDDFPFGFGAYLSAEAEEHLRSLEIDLNIESERILGRAKVWLLQQDNTPTATVITSSEPYQHQERGIDETLESSLRVGINCVQSVSDSVSFDNGTFHVAQGYSIAVNSESQLSLYGIRVSDPILRSGGVFERVRDDDLTLPFPCVVRVDIAGSEGLTLNVARNEVLRDDRWRSFCSNLCRGLLEGIRSQVDKRYWDALVDVWTGLLINKPDKAGANVFLSELDALK